MCTKKSKRRKNGDIKHQREAKQMTQWFSSDVTFFSAQLYTFFTASILFMTPNLQYLFPAYIHTMLWVNRHSKTQLRMICSSKYIFCFFSTFLMTKCVIKTLANGKFDSVYIFNIKKNWIYIGRHGISHKCSKSILLNEQIWKLTKNWYYKEKFSI